MPTYRVSVLGPRREAAAALEAVAALEAPEVVVRDLAQRALGDGVITAAELTGAPPDPAALRQRLGAALGPAASIVVASAPLRPARDDAYVASVLAALVAPGALARVVRAMVGAGAAVEHVTLLTRQPVMGYEIEVRTSDPDALRRAMGAAAAADGLDVALQRDVPARGSRRLVVMDADSTLLQDEVIDRLAEICGRAAEVQAITRAAMAGELDFAESLRRRVATLAGAPASVLDEVRAVVSLTPGARTLVRTLQRLGHVPAVVSGGFVEVLAPLLAELGIEHYAANHLEIVEGHLTGRVVGEILDRAGKAAALRRFAAELGIPLERTVAIGDGANDIDMLVAAGLGVAFNAKPVVREHADATLSVPNLDAVLVFLGLRAEA